jgi:histidinol-phosphatase
MDDLRLAQLLADVAAEISMRHFRAGPGPGRSKADGTMVGDADLAVDRALIDRLGRERPGDAVLSEESGTIGEGRRVWILDPIDGTASFLAGRRLWGTTIALAVDGEPTIGVVSSPSLDRRYWGERGKGAHRAALRGGPPARLTVSRRRSPESSTFATWPPDAREGARLREVCRTKEPRVVPPVDVVEGALDACVCVGGGPWDYAPLVVLVEESGGRYSDRGGGRRIDRGCAVFTNGGPVHERILGALAAP